MPHLGLCSIDTWLNILKKCTTWVIHVDNEIVKKPELVLTCKMLDVTSKFPA
jgi:hypothetical protein